MGFVGGIALSLRVQANPSDRGGFGWRIARNLEHRRLQFVELTAMLDRVSSPKLMAAMAWRCACQILACREEHSEEII